jgi:SprT-like family
MGARKKRKKHSLGRLTSIAELLWLKFFTAAPAVQRTCPRAPLPAESLEILWKRLQEQYFPERRDLEKYDVRWSSRPQRRVLASCQLRRRRVVVARELYPPQYQEWLEPLLFHEMCHAVLGILPNHNGRRAWHGAEFKALVKRHHRTEELELWIETGGWREAVQRGGTL